MTGHLSLSSSCLFVDCEHAHKHKTCTHTHARARDVRCRHFSPSSVSVRWRVNLVARSVRSPRFVHLPRVSVAVVRALCDSPSLGFVLRLVAFRFRGLPFLLFCWALCSVLCASCFVLCASFFGLVLRSLCFVLCALLGAWCFVLCALCVVLCVWGVVQALTPGTNDVCVALARRFWLTR